MADWTNIPNGNIETGKPIRAIDGRALRDNPIAIAEGAVGAPRIRIGALQRLTAGNETRVQNNPGAAASGTLFNLSFIQAGSVRVSFTGRSSTGAYTFTRTRGATVTTIASANINTVTGGAVHDVDVLPGDKLLVNWSGGGAGSGLYNGTISTNGEDYFPASLDTGTAVGNTYNA